MKNLIIATFVLATILISIPANASRVICDFPSEYTDDWGVEVLPGDNLWGISEEFLGNGTRWWEIYTSQPDDNKPEIIYGNDPDDVLVLIYPGKLIRVGWGYPIPQECELEQEGYEITGPVINLDEHDNTPTKKDAGTGFWHLLTILAVLIVLITLHGIIRRLLDGRQAKIFFRTNWRDIMGAFRRLKHGIKGRPKTDDGEPLIKVVRDYRYRPRDENPKPVTLFKCFRSRREEE